MRLIYLRGGRGLHRCAHALSPTLPFLLLSLFLFLLLLLLLLLGGGSPNATTTSSPSRPHPSYVCVVV